MFSHGSAEHYNSQ